MRSLLALSFLPLLVVGKGNAQAKPDQARVRTAPADKAELAAITARGRALAAYDAAAWYGSDAVKALNPPEENMGIYLGNRSDQGWVMGFGRLNDAKDAFLLAFEAVPTQDVTHPSVIAHHPMIEDREVWFHEALAFDKFRSELTGHGRPYNLAVTPAPNGNWFVYSYPAQTDLAVFPYGGDTRFTVSADGVSPLATHKMHMSILENKKPKGVAVEMTYRTSFLDDAPEDSDVSSVLMMGHIPMLVVGKNFVYRVEEDGTANYVTTTKALLEDAGKAK